MKVHLLDHRVMFGSWIDWNLDIWRKLDGQYCAKEDKQRWRLDRLGTKLHQIHNSDSSFAALTSNIIMFIMRKSASLLTIEKGGCAQRRPVPSSEPAPPKAMFLLWVEAERFGHLPMT